MCVCVCVCVCMRVYISSMTLCSTELQLTIIKCLAGVSDGCPPERYIQRRVERHRGGWRDTEEGGETQRRVERHRGGWRDTVEGGETQRRVERHRGGWRDTVEGGETQRRVERHRGGWRDTEEGGETQRRVERHRSARSPALYTTPHERVVMRVGPEGYLAAEVGLNPRRTGVNL